MSGFLLQLRPMNGEPQGEKTLNHSHQKGAADAVNEHLLRRFANPFVTGAAWPHRP